MVEPLPGYRIGEVIGTGAGSRICTATDLKTGETVAVKHVIRQSAQDDRFIEQVQTEFDISSKLEHPHLRRSLHLHRIRRLLVTKEVYLVMEHVEGLPLLTALPNRLMTFLTIFQKISLGLHAMHDAGFVHSDIKPNNIMIGPKGVVKVIDFGQSCRIGHRKERIQGTPDYIAPEQVRRLPLDARTDVFNLGATMYWVLTSENYPTSLRVDAAAKDSLMNPDKPLAPVELNDKIPVSLSNLVMECCQDNPIARPVDMKQVGARLEVVAKLWRKHRETVRAELRQQTQGGNTPCVTQPRPPTSSDEPLN